MWIDWVEEGKQHRDHADQSENATARLGGKNLSKENKIYVNYDTVRLLIWSLNFQQNAALALDQSILDVDQVENLIKFCPTKEEMELLKVYINEILLCLVCDVILTRPHLPFSCQNYSGDKELLGKCELVLTIYDLW
jgi:hypothetical protein